MPQDHAHDHAKPHAHPQGHPQGPSHHGRHHGDDHADQHHGGHHHTHVGHVHAPADFGRAFILGIGLNSALVAAQVVFGLIAGSLALMADAGHNLGDVFGLIMAWRAAAMAKRPPNARHTWGYGRGSILAALTNGVILLVGVGAIGLEAIHRLLAPQPVEAGLVVWVAAAGILINGGTALLFMRGHHDLNIRGAFLHMVGDAAVSVAVVLAGVLILFTGWLWLDSVASLLVVAVITWGTWGLLRSSIALAMDAVPPGIDIHAVEAWLAARPGVQSVHDLHIWPISTTETALTVHLVRPGGLSDQDRIGIADGLHREFLIGHVTLQTEDGDTDHPCALAPADVI